MLAYYIFIFIIGLSVGSFLNVVIFRLENGWKIVNDRSKCLHCKHALSWQDLFPVLSFILLKGKCRYCRKKISWQYPIVETGTGVLFVMISYYILRINGLTDYGAISDLRFTIYDLRILFPLIYYFFIASALIVIFVYDYKHYIIPDEVIYFASSVALLYNFIIDNTLQYFVLSAVKDVSGLQAGSNYFADYLSTIEFIFSNSLFLNYLSAAAVSFSFFFLIVFATKGKGMGGGDVKLGFLMGLVLGWPNIFAAILLSFVMGSIFGLALVFSKQKGMKSMIPFGPFLVAGTFLMMFWGKEIITWYFGYIN